MSNPSRRDRFSIRSEAFELARSGKYADWVGIQASMEATKGVFDDEGFQEELDKLCFEAIKRDRAEAERQGKTYQEPLTPLTLYDCTADPAKGVRNTLIVEEEKQQKSQR